MDFGNSTHRGAQSAILERNRLARWLFSADNVHSEGWALSHFGETISRGLL
jgi:hypothetical protein